MKEILAPVQGDNDGCSYHRIIVPSRFINDSTIRISLHNFVINKYSSFPVRAPGSLINKYSDKLWDNLKLVERKLVTFSNRKYDAIWINRSLLNFKNRVDFSLKRVIYDFDDAVWLREADFAFEHYCRSAMLVFAGNSFLAEKASAFSNKIVTVPTSVDTERYANTKTYKERFQLGWIGSSTGISYLLSIQSELALFFEKHQDARLIIVSDTYPHELSLIKNYIIYKKWERERDVEYINEFSVGLMPLNDTEWDRGKCSFKMLQYMACEVPVIVSMVGMNREVMSLESTFGKFGVGVKLIGEWNEAFEYLFNCDYQTLGKMGLNGRKVIESKYSSKIIAELIKRELLIHL